MVSIMYIGKTGQYKVSNRGKNYYHATKNKAEAQMSAILRVEKKRSMRKR